jgi:hypothetical protein
MSAKAMVPSSVMGAVMGGIVSGSPLRVTVTISPTWNLANSLLAVACPAAGDPVGAAVTAMGGGVGASEKMASSLDAHPLKNTADKVNPQTVNPRVSHVQLKFMGSYPCEICATINTFV